MTVKYGKLVSIFWTKLQEHPKLLNNITSTCYETLMLQYDPETKRQKTLREFIVFHRLKKAKVSKSKFKNTIMVSFLPEEELSSLNFSSRPDCQPHVLN
jgi:hypothetical protein